MILPSVLALLGLGLTAAVVLAVASRLLYVKEDPRIAAVEDALPGVNCGGCGYPGCGGCAEAVVKGQAPVSACVVGGVETANKVAAVMGQEVGYVEPQLAEVDCDGGLRAGDLYIYEGADSCRAQALLHGGGKKCAQGCLGLGSCVAACPFDAIHMGAEGTPVVDPEKCRACNKCVEACPRGVIEVKGLTARLLHMNQYTDCLAPCKQRCPGQIDIPRYIERIRMGDYAGAVAVIRERNPLTLVCGRVCPHPCEYVCRRGAIDEPIAINPLKRFVSDLEMEKGERPHIPCAPDTGRKVAVIGGGPAGLSCAYFLRRLGHNPTIFETKPRLGGQLRYGIPEYRLPKKDLDWEIDGILALGVETRLEVKFGRDFTLDDVWQEGFEAVFLGCGAWAGSSMRCEGEDAPGVLSGLEFLTAVGLGHTVELSETVIVVGGGNTAIDAARTAVRLGKQVTLMYRRTRKEMPANSMEIDAAEEEGVHMQFLSQPVRVVTGPDGRAIGLEYVRMELGEPDATGRRKPVPVQGSEQTAEAGTIIAAIGQKPDLSCLYGDGKECSLEQTRWRTVAANPSTLQTSDRRVFVGGDMHSGPDLVISAVGEGRRAARSIHYLLTQGAIPDIPHEQTGLMPDTLFKTIEGYPAHKRVDVPELCADERHCNFKQVELTISEEEALYESTRCLRCGLVCFGGCKPVQPVEMMSEQEAAGRGAAK